MNRIGVRKTLSSYSVGIRDSWVINIMPGLYNQSVRMLDTNTEGLFRCSTLMYRHTHTGPVQYAQAAMMVYLYCLSTVISEQSWQKSISALNKCPEREQD